MIETSKRQERVILLGVELPETENFEMSMEELASLAKTAGAEVVSSYRQKREKYDSKSLIGSGKLAEIKAIVEADEIDTVIVNDRLTPRQNVNLEVELGVKVIDRMQLILDIFAMRARSHEGKLQVHLAQLKYMLPRLVGQGVMLSRQAGGIGSRGPGESQLELNRRSIRHQISDIERQLKVVEKNRETGREKRTESQVFKIGLIGYTNAGKSTIMNVLTNDKQYEADELFATLDATTKQIYLQNQFQVTLTDTVGLHVIDASDPNHAEHEKVVLNLLKELDMLDIPRLAVYNKMDVAEHLVATAFPNVRISARDKDARTLLRRLIINEIREIFEPFSIRVHQSQAYKLYELNKIALLDHYDFAQEYETITGYINPKNKWRLEEFYD